MIGAGVRWTYRDLEAEVARWAGHLAAAGVRPGDRVALLRGNRPDFVAQVHAIGRLGAISVPINIRLSPSEFRFQIQRIGASLILADPALEQMVEDTGLIFRSSGEGEPVGPRPLDREAPYAILFTSGTTGRPKPAGLTWGNFVASAHASALNLGSDPSHCWLAVLPLFHVAGLAMLTRAAIHGATLVVQERFEPLAVNEAIDEGASHISLVPITLARTLEARGEREFPPTLKVILVGGGPVPAALLVRARRQGAPVLQTYGLTEACSQVTTERLDQADGITAGPAVGGIEVRVVDSHGTPLPPGKVGEIEVRGPTVMKGYYDDEEATREALVGGWLRTRDLGTLDEQGRLRVFARRTDLILSGGENVYPAEVEAVLLQHPAVMDAAVIGLPDPAWGQRVVSAVVVRADVEDGELERYCRQRLAGYKVPRRFLRMDALPRNATGKVDRTALLEKFGYLAGSQTP